MKDYCPQNWQEILRQNNLDGFDSMWAVEADWFEPPNKRRGGWSGVVRLELQLPDGASVGLFLKRQENHTRRTAHHPLSGESTINGEIRNILALEKAGVPSLVPVFYGERIIDGNRRAILATQELEGYLSLNQQMQVWIDQGWENSIEIRKGLIKTLAGSIRRMHEHRLVHNALHPKHVFVRLVKDEAPEVCLIDLEKMRRSLSVTLASRRDLDSLNRRTREWNRGSRLLFLKTYMGDGKGNPELRKMWRFLVKKANKFLQKEAAKNG